MQGWKMRAWINRHQTAGLENARQASMDSQSLINKTNFKVKQR